MSSHKGSWSRVKDYKAWQESPLWDKDKKGKAFEEFVESEIDKIKSTGKLPDYIQAIPPFTIKLSD